MRLVGEIIGMSHSGYSMVRNPDIPNKGATIFNENHKKIGKVVDIIGPTRNPYILIDCRNPKIGKKLFV